MRIESNTSRFDGPPSCRRVWICHGGWWAGKISADFDDGERRERKGRVAAIVTRRARSDVRAITIKTASIFGYTSCPRNAGDGTRETNARACIKFSLFPRSGEKKASSLSLPLFLGPFRTPIFARPGQTPFLFFPAAELFPRWRTGWFIGP